MKYITTILLILLSNTVQSQDTSVYIGSLITSNNIPISFKLEFQEQNGIINGFSITNIDTKDETKSEIVGLYFKTDRSYQIEETQIIQTNSEEPLESFCYVKMNLTIKGRFGSKRLEGTFTGNFIDNEECASGKIILLEEYKIKKILEKIEKKIEKEKKKVTTIKKISVIKSGDDLSINWKSKKLIIKIWDANKEDGDRVDLLINNKIILQNFKTKSKPKKIKLKLKKGINTVYIKATNEGSSPPNTSRIELIDNNTKYPILIQLEKNKSVNIKIIK